MAEEAEAEASRLQHLRESWGKEKGSAYSGHEWSARVIDARAYYAAGTVQRGGILMIESEILKEKHRIQAELSKDSASIHDYLLRSHAAAIEIAESFGFCLQYADMPKREGDEAGIQPQQLG